MLTLTPNNQLSLSKPQLIHKPRPFIPYEEMTDEDIFNGSGDLVFDSECFPNYFLIAFRHVATGKVIKLVPPFDPRKLSFILHHYRCIGFNSLKYDIPLLWASYIRQDLYWLKEVSNALVSGEWYQEICKQYSIRIFDTDHIDLIEVCPNQGSLKLYGARLHTPRLQELPFHHMEELTEEQKLEVENYCINADLVSTAITYEFNKDRLALREFLGQEYNENLMSKSDAQMAEAIMRREIKKRTGAWPKKPSLTEDYQFQYERPAYLKFNSPQLNGLLNDISSHTFRIDCAARVIRPDFLRDRTIKLNNLSYEFGIGGLHSKEKNIAYKSNEEYQITDKDVASYYPKIISNLKLAPEGLGPIFLDVFDGLTAARLDAKAKKAFAKDKGLKIAINGASGKFNSEHSVMFSPKCYVQMTLTGQLSILQLAEMFEENDIQVISANTDGIVLYHKRDKYDKLEQIIKHWETATRYPTEEGTYKAYYGRDVNAYFAHKSDNTIKLKGPYSEVGSQTGTQLDNNPIMLICSDAIKKLLTDEVPIEETIKNCRNLSRFITVRNVKGGGYWKNEYLGKVVRWVYARNEFEAIRYVESGNKVATTDGALPLMDWPDEWPNIDYDRYIEETRNIMYDIGMLKRPEQIRFF